MSFTGETVLERYESVLAAATALDLSVSEVRQLDEPTVLRINELHSRIGRLLGAAGAVIAGDLAYRSRPELGSDGLARRTGHRTVETLLKITTGATREQVRTAIRAGTLLTEVADEGTVDEATGEVKTPTQPWLRPVAAAVGPGEISTSVSSSIASGLGTPNSAVTCEQLQTAAQALVAATIAGMDADRVFNAAKELRNEMDLAGVKLREDEAYAARGITHFPLPNGGGKAILTMDPENYALFVDVYDRMTSPKRGGVRFIDKTRAAQAEGIRNDDRTFQQIALDGFMHLLVAGSSVDDSVMLGSGAPEVRITVAAEALECGIGIARIDGQLNPVSIGTARRLVCGGVLTKMRFDSEGNYIPGTGADVTAESESRLFSRRQRRILAAKFGGCMDPNCDRPPAWCEAHHIIEWAKNGGPTIIENGILLCKYHHLLYHNAGYEIRRDDLGNYWQIPPASIDPDRAQVLMPFKTRNLADLAAATGVARC